MIEVVLAHTDLARMRFAHSPIRELAASLRTLQDPTRRHVYGTWLSDVRGRLHGVRLDLLTALSPVGRFAVDFLMPEPTRPWEVLDDELEAVVHTTPEHLRADLDIVYEGRRLPAVLRPLYDDPARHLPAVVDELHKYWQAAIEPIWEQVRALNMADLSYRMERFAAGGIARVLEDLHPEISFEHDRLLIHKPHHCRHRIDLQGKGILLLPCAFSWPTLLVLCCGADQPALIYPARGVAELWHAPQDDHTDPLCALIGRTRAALLATLGLPRTTTQLAELLDLSPAAVSQHLRILKDTTLVSSRRRGRMVLYQRTPAASSLLTAMRPDRAAR